ncbi:hypothetical protein L1276_001401 [Flavobacterium sp. HSC-32F16]|uniref:hypothetical protein n=1 Tax=Flavobacterium sp. HSC-32F16 TaxID=2910964 RepID=UPI0020A3E5D0|nr:hypothetical protein [Flavobacterium sp. HSC-32F16]MCP2026257.1 hypothetical protein [Flavobacterium sp. HSC-32F16]
MLKIFKFFLLISILQSCNSNQQNPALVIKKQATVIEKNSEFDLMLINFKENPAKLYSKNILNSNDVLYDNERDGKLTDEMLQYKITNIITDVMNITIPTKKFGYLYKSPELDSIAKFKNIYFNSLSLLTNIDKKPVAFYAETTFSKENERKKNLDEITKKLGNPKYSYTIGNEFDRRSYEWVLSDRTIQIETSFGFSMSMDSNGNSSNGKYYPLSILIIDNKNKNDLYKAHEYEFPDKILFKGKYHSYKDFQFEKNTVFEDNFLLNSSNETNLKAKYGLYDNTPVEAEQKTTSEPTVKF